MALEGWEITVPVSSRLAAEQDSQTMKATCPGLREGLLVVPYKLKEGHPPSHSFAEQAKWLSRIQE